MMKYSRLLFHVAASLAITLPLSGCVEVLNPYMETFRCRAALENGKCVDTPSAYEEAIGNQQTERKTLKAEESGRRPEEAGRINRVAELLEEPPVPEIAAPRVLRVLILPYKSGGDLFMSRYVYLQVEPANWVLTGVDEGLE